MMEIYSNMLSKEDGEFACMGTFTPGWVSHLGELRIPDQDLRGVKKFLRHAVFGARCLMREYARIREVAEGDARPLRQTSIMQYVVEEVPADKMIKGKKPAPVVEMGSSPPIDIWASTAGGWGRVIWKGGDVRAPPCVSLPQVRLRQLHLGDCGLGDLAHPSLVSNSGTNESKLIVPEVEDQAGRKGNAAVCNKNIKGSGAAIPREGTDSPVRTIELREPRKTASSSVMRTLFPDPRAGWSSDIRAKGGPTAAHPRGCNVPHDQWSQGGRTAPSEKFFP